MSMLHVTRLLLYDVYAICNGQPSKVTFRAMFVCEYVVPATKNCCGLQSFCVDTFKTYFLYWIDQDILLI